MTTTVDPYGTPSTIFTRSGSSIQEINAPIGSVVDLDAPSGVANFVVTVTGAGSPTSSDGVRLPASAEVGDVANVFVIGNLELWVHAPAGENISGYSEHSLSAIPTGTSFLKYNSTSWALAARS